MKLGPKRVGLLFVVLGVGFCLTLPATTVHSWTAGAGNAHWHVPGNWSNGVVPGPNPPSDDYAGVGASATPPTHSSDSGDSTVWKIAVYGGGTLNVTGGTLTTQDYFNVGTNGSGTVNISGGILNMDTLSSYPRIGAASGSAGFVNVTGTGTLNIAPGRITHWYLGMYAPGKIVQDGAGTTVNLGAVRMGYTGGNGVFELKAGQATTTTPSRQSWRG